MELIEKLTANLGVKHEQACRGAGLLLRAALKEMGEPAVANVFELIPELEGLLTVPNEKQVDMGDGRESACLADQTDRRRNPDLAGEFLQLGMGCEMISRFIPSMLAYIQQRGGERINELTVSDLKED